MQFRAVLGEEHQQRISAKQSVLWWWVLLVVVAGIHLTYWTGYQRELIRLDDWQYIKPLGSLSLSDYLGSWMWSQDKLAFPVRDLSFLFDFWVHEVSGYRSFVATSVVIFLIYLSVLRRVLRFYVPEPFVLPCLAIVALHPVSVEVLHWVISRKHLLVGLFTGIYVLQIESFRQTSTNAAVRLWGSTVAYGLSILSHPTGVFLPLFGVIRLRRCLSRSMLWLHIFTTAGIATLWLGLSSSINQDYGALFSSESVQSGGVGRILTYGVMAIGRGFYQLLVPISQAIYREPVSREQIVGLGLMAVWVFLVWSSGRDRAKIPRERPFEPVTLSALVLLLFLPQLLFVVRRTEFAMADRFLFLSLPYFVALTCIGIYPWVAPQNRAMRPVLCGALGLVLLFFAVQTRRILPLWDSAEVVFRHCIDRADSEQCWWHLSDELFQRGCADLMRDEQSFAAKLASLRGNRPSIFTNEGYFRLAVCVGTATSAGPEVKNQFLERYARDGARPESLTFARSLVALERGDRRRALNEAMDVYGGKADTSAFSLMMLGIERGLLEGICASGDSSDRECAHALEVFSVQYGLNPLESRFINFGRHAAIEQWSRRQNSH